MKKLIPPITFKPENFNNRDLAVKERLNYFLIKYGLQEKTNFDHIKKLSLTYTREDQNGITLNDISPNLNTFFKEVFNFCIPGVYDFFDMENKKVEHKGITGQLRNKLDQIKEYQGDKTALSYLKLVLSCVYIHYVKGLSIISLPEVASLQKRALEFDSDVDTNLLRPIIENDFIVLT